MVRGSRFYHGTLGITAAFPTGWSVQNLPTKVTAANHQKDAFMHLTAVAQPPNVLPREFLARSLPGEPLYPSQEPLEVNGLQGHTAVARDVALPWGNRGPAR